MTTTEHTAKIVTGTKASPYRATCSCGWRARPTMLKELSEQIARKHTNHHARMASK